MAGYKFNYEKKVWGGDIIRINPIYFRASRLYWALKGLGGVKGKILDAGCGAGDFAEAISFYRPDLTIYAIDISKKAISLAEKRGLKVNFEVADIQNLPFEDSFFDAVVCFDLIEHVEDPLKALKEVSRVLKTRGLFHSFIPTERNIFTLEGLLIKFGWKAKEIYGGHPQHFGVGEVFQMVGNCGFKIIGYKWGDHLVHQLSEIALFSYLALRGKNMPTTIEGFLSKDTKSIAGGLLRLGKNLVASLSFAETMLLCWLPALGLHLTCRKR